MQIIRTKATGFVQDTMFSVLLWRDVPQDQKDNKLENLILSAIRADCKKSKQHCFSDF